MIQAIQQARQEYEAILHCNHEFHPETLICLRCGMGHDHIEAMLVCGHRRNRVAVPIEAADEAEQGG